MKFNLRGPLGLFIPVISASPLRNAVLESGRVPEPASYDNACNIGFCSIGGATVGGWGGGVTTVGSLGELRGVVGHSGLGVVIIEGEHAGEGVRINVGPNKSIIGNPGSSLKGIQLVIGPGSSNVILRNLNFSGAGSGIHINNSRNIWVDHSDFSPATQSSSSAPLLSITNGADSVTVTNNIFRSHQGAPLDNAITPAVQVGHSESNSAEDAGKFRVTFAGNLFRDVRSAISFRFGTAHVMNSLFQNVTNGINTLNGADVLVETSVFEGAMVGKGVYSEPAGTTPGRASVKDVKGLGGEGELSVTAPAGNVTTDSLPYPYDWYVLGVDAVRESVLENAGSVLQFPSEEEEEGYGEEE